MTAAAMNRRALLKSAFVAPLLALPEPAGAAPPSKNIFFHDGLTPPPKGAVFMTIETGPPMPMVFVQEGSKAWDAWIAHRARSARRVPTAWSEGKTGWWFESLFPPATLGDALPNTPVTPEVRS